MSRKPPSLTRRLLLQAGLAIVVLTSGLTAVSYRHIADYSEGTALAALSRQVQARAERESLLLRQAEGNHRALASAVLDGLAAPSPEDTELRWQALVRQDADGAWRSRPEGFRPDWDAGIWVDDGARVDPALKRRVLLFQRLASEYGRAWQTQFLNTYILAEENLAVPFWPSAPDILRQLDAGFDIRDQEYYSIATAKANPARRTVWTGLYPDPQTRVWMVSVETPVYQGERQIATVGNDIPLSELVARSLAKQGDGAYDAILRGDGRLILHPDYLETLKAKGGDYYIPRDGTPELKRLYGLVRGIPGGQGLVSDEAGQRFLAVGRIEGPGWYYVRVLPAAAVERLAQSTAGLVLLFGAVALAAGLVILHTLLSRRLARPLLKLTQAAERMARGGASTPLAVNSQDEVGRLADSFNRMSAALAERDRALARQLEALKDSEARFRVAFESAPIGVTLVSPDGRFLEVNAKLCEFLGYGADELLGKSFLDFTHPDDRESSLGQIEALQAQDGASIQFEKRYVRPGGEIVWALVSSNLQRDADGQPRYFLTQVLDITGRRQTEAELNRLAFHDPLTGLPNRALFTEFLRRAIRRIARQGEAGFAVMFLDLDRFKLVNDSLGHLSGDRLLMETARRLQELLRPGDVAARFGGDEFCVLVENPLSLADVESLALRMQEGLSQSMPLDGERVRCPASIGIVLSSAERQSPEEYLRDADSAMYHAKQAGRNRYCVFEAHMHAQAQSQLRLEAELRQALAQDEFEAYFQPIVDLPDGRIRRFEALVRWRHPARGLLAPACFIGAAEELDLIARIDCAVLAKALYQVKQWREERGHAQVRVNVNASSQLLHTPGLVQHVQDLLNELGLAPDSLNLEITESVLIRDPEQTLNVLNRLAELGVGVHLDDFGTGYSSLSYLHRFPIHNVKLDRSFISRLEVSSKDRTIVEGIILLATRLGLGVTAEGVETGGQRALIAELKASSMQGYLSSPPVDAAAATRLLIQNRQPQPEALPES